MKNAWFDIRFANAVGRGMVFCSQFRMEFAERVGGSVVELGCLDAPDFMPVGNCRKYSDGNPSCAIVYRVTAWDFGEQNRECVRQFGEGHGEELLFLVYRLGAVNQCRQYCFESVAALVKWAQRKPYSGEALRVMVCIDRKRVGEMFVRPGCILQAVANFTQWHCGRLGNA